MLTLSHVDPPSFVVRGQGDQNNLFPIFNGTYTFECFSHSRSQPTHFTVVSSLGPSRSNTSPMSTSLQPSANLSSSASPSLSVLPESNLPQSSHIPRSSSDEAHPSPDLSLDSRLQLTAPSALVSPPSDQSPALNAMQMEDLSRKHREGRIHRSLCAILRRV